MPLTIDASVFVAAAIPTEVHFGDSTAFLSKIQQQPQTLVCPTLLLPETIASVARRTGNPMLAQAGIRRIALFPGMTLVPLGEQRAQQAAHIGATYRLRGADAIYIALAVEFGATVITWDAEMLTRGAGAVSVLTPSDWQTTYGN